MNLQFIQQLYAATPLYERNATCPDIGPRPKNRPTHYREIPFETVEDARRMHREGMGPLAITHELERRGHRIKVPTVKDWVYFRSRTTK